MLLQWNMRGYHSQRPHLQNTIDELNPHIICLQETHLKKQNTTSLTKYHFPPMRKDRTNKKGGGIAIFIHNSIPFIPIKIDTEAEILGTYIILNNKKITLLNAYFPPDIDIDKIRTYINEIKNLITGPFILTMDSNAHHTQWGSAVMDPRGKLIAEWIENNEYILLNNGEPTFLTHSGTFTHIDLTICSSDIAVDIHWKPHHNPCNSDHFPIIIKTADKITPHERSIKWNIKSANWTKFTNTINIPENFVSPNQACDSVTQAINSAAENSITKTNQTNVRPSAYWWNKDCTIAKRTKNKALTKYKNHLGNLEYWIAFKKAKAKFRYTVRRARDDSWKDFLRNLTNKNTSTELWKHVNLIRNKPSYTNIVLKINNNYITDHTEIADTLAQHFALRSNGDTPDIIFKEHKTRAEKQTIDFSNDNYTMYNKPLTIEELKLALQTCTSKSPGPDTLPYIFIQKFTNEQLTQLLNFYNYIYSNGFPEQWREGIIIPLPKPNKPTTQCDSYRPITLTNCLSKLMEKILNRRLQHYLESINFYSTTQSGFRAKHSTLDGLVRLGHTAQRAINENKYCIAVFLDISQAFDTVWLHGLLTKLHSTGLKGNLARYIREFLQNRKISVKVGNTISSKYPLHSGVPQGSVMSPTLFTVMINDIFDECPENIQTSLYADDGAMWLITDNLQQGLADLQKAIDEVSKWSHKWGLQVSHKKTTAMIITHKHTRNPAPLLLHNHPITFTTTSKFLGITFDTRLTWGKHITNIKNRCLKDLQLLRIISYNKLSSDYETLKRIYTALILPKINYASFLYTHASITQLTKLDRLQYAAIRIILGIHRFTPTFKLEIEANILPLNIRRKRILLQYGTRVSCLINHPIKIFLEKHRPIHMYLSDRYKLTPLEILHKTLNEISINTEKVANTPMKSYYSYTVHNIHTSLADIKKEQRSDELWRLFFDNMIDTKYKNRTQVYTDGSCREDRSGCGIWSNEFQLKSRLPDKTSIFTTELYAIYAAINFVSRLDGQFVILSDSLSAIKALSSFNYSDHYLLVYIINSLNKIENNKITIEWVPSHVGIVGNENDDKIAGEATHMTSINQISPCLSAMRHCIRVACEADWTGQWQSLGTTLTAHKPTIGPTAYWNESRKCQITMSRVRLSSTLLTHGHYLNKTEARECPHCHVKFTLKHLLIECTQLAPSRQEMLNHCSSNSLVFNLQNITTPPFPAILIMKFLSETSFLNQI